MLWTIVLIVVGVLVAAIVLVLVVAATRPDTFRVQRSAAIHAPPEKVFPLINDFRSWREWSPWEKMDPNLKRDYSGPSDGKGAVYGWEGNKRVGKGRMEIKDTSPPNRITIQLDFFKPFKAHNTTVFTLEPLGDSTHVTWTMEWGQPFLFKVMSLFMNLDRMIGKDFEAGLADMKAAAEK